MLQAGKALSDKKCEVRIQFHAVPGVVGALSHCAGNELVVRLQPEESIYWKARAYSRVAAWAYVGLQPEEAIRWGGAHPSRSLLVEQVQNKVPGLHFEVQQMRMDLLYSSKFFQRKLPEAYERLLLEVLAADHSHFVSAEELDASWHIFTPVLQELEALAPPRAADAGPARPGIRPRGPARPPRGLRPLRRTADPAGSAAPLGASGIQGHRPLFCHAHAMHTPCTRHAHAMHTPCTRHAHAMHTMCGVPPGAHERQALRRLVLEFRQRLGARLLRFAPRGAAGRGAFYRRRLLRRGQLRLRHT